MILLDCAAYLFSHAPIFSNIYVAPIDYTLQPYT